VGIHQVIEEVECIRLPCSHIMERPIGSVNVVCAYDGRKWHVYNKGVEVCAREEH
jgi:hypothetical protein